MTMTTPSPVKLAEAMRLARAGQPWCIRLETRPGATTKTGARRYAFWQVSGLGAGGCLLRHGRIGSAGQKRGISYADVSRKVSEKLAGDYQYAGETSPAVPVAAQPPAQRVVTLRDRLGNTTMRPTTMYAVWQKVSDEGWVKQTTDADYTGIFAGCEALTLWVSERGQWWVVVAYPNDEWVWGAVKSD